MSNFFQRTQVFDDAATVLKQYTPTATIPTLSPVGNAVHSSSPISVSPLSNLYPSDRGDAEAESIIPKTAVSKSKCTSPTNLTTLFENVPSSHFEVFQNDGELVTTANNQNSSQIQLNCNSSEKAHGT